MARCIFHGHRAMSSQKHSNASVGVLAELELNQTLKPTNIPMKIDMLFIKCDLRVEKQAEIKFLPTVGISVLTFWLLTFFPR